MALTIEDGSVVAGADSYATASELATYAANFGRVIPDSAPEQESILRRAYLEMSGLAWKGAPVSIDQTGAWPRRGVVKSGFSIPADTIPQQIKAGQMALAAEIHADDLNPPEQRKGAVVKDRVEGAVERQYAPASATTSKAASGRQSTAQFVGFIEGGSQIKLRRS